MGKVQAPLARKYPTTVINPAPARAIAIEPNSIFIQLPTTLYPLALDLYNN
jgi:hypothetical protein